VRKETHCGGEGGYRGQDVSLTITGSALGEIVKGGKGNAYFPFQGLVSENEEEKRKSVLLCCLWRGKRGEGR